MNPDQYGDIKPVPDPTKLTTENLTREIERVKVEYLLALQNLREYHQLDIHRLKELADAKIDEIGTKISCMEEIFNEKLNAIELQFSLVERQRLESKQDNQLARDEAMSSMKESVHSLGVRYDANHTSLVAAVDSNHTTFTSSLDEAKTRITALEAIRMGGKESNATMYAVFGIILTVIWIAIAVLSYMHK